MTPAELRQQYQTITGKKFYAELGTPYFSDHYVQFLEAKVISLLPYFLNKDNKNS